MFSPRELITATRNECQALALQKTLPFDVLLIQARHEFKNRTELDILEASLSGMLSDTSSSTIEHKLAELLYFHQGRMLVEHRQYNKMTRLQMEHECLARALLTPEQLPAISNFRLRVFIKTDQEQIPPAQNSLVFGPASPVDSGCFSGEDFSNVRDDDEGNIDSASESEESDDEQSNKAIYVNVRNPRLGRFVTYRY